MTTISDAMKKKGTPEAPKPGKAAPGAGGGAGGSGPGGDRQRLSRPMYPVSSLLREAAGKQQKPPATHPAPQRRRPNPAPVVTAQPPKSPIDVRIVAVGTVVLLAVAAGFVLTPDEKPEPVKKAAVGSLDTIEAKMADRGMAPAQLAAVGAPYSDESSGVVSASSPAQVDTVSVPSGSAEHASAAADYAVTSMTDEEFIPAPVDESWYAAGPSEPIDLESQLVPQLDPELMPELELPPALDYAMPSAGSSSASRPSAPAIQETGINRYKLEGIFWDPPAPAAIINDEILEEGDRIGDLRVVKIERASVTVEYQGREHVLR